MSFICYTNSFMALIRSDCCRHCAYRPWWLSVAHGWQVEGSCWVADLRLLMLMWPTVSLLVVLLVADVFFLLKVPCAACCGCRRWHCCHCWYFEFEASSSGSLQICNWRLLGGSHRCFDMLHWISLHLCVLALEYLQTQRVREDAQTLGVRR